MHREKKGRNLAIVRHRSERERTRTHGNLVRVSAIERGAFTGDGGWMPTGRKGAVAGKLAGRLRMNGTNV